MPDRRIHLGITTSLAAALVALGACGSTQEPAITNPAPSAAMVPAGANVVEVLAEDYAFDAPDEIPAGWTTFRMRNVGEETHFIYLSRMPEGRTMDDYVQGVGMPINELWYRLRAGEIDKSQIGPMLGEALPAWFFTGVQAKGGPGLAAPGGVSQATVHLEPGTYVMECFMKTPEGELHWMEGMIRPLVVTAATTGAPEPDADVQVTVTTTGFIAPKTLAPGVHRVEVRFADQPELGFGNDVHVVRLADGMDASELVPWMDFMNVEGLENPAPATFVGGTHERPEGQKAYFTAELESGRYAWIAEAPDAYNLVQEFIVE